MSDEVKNQDTMPETTAQTEPQATTPETLEPTVDSYEAAASAWEQGLSATVPATEPKDEPTPTSEPAADPDGATDDKAVESSAEESKVPAEWFISARASGFSDEEINSLIEKDADTANNILGKLHKVHVGQATELSQTGTGVRKRLEELAEQAKIDFKQSDQYKQLQEKYGESDAWEAISAAYETIHKQRIEHGQELAAAVSDRNPQEAVDLTQVVTDFFGRNDIGFDDDHFGRGKTNTDEGLTVAQLQTRAKVLNLADDMRAAAAYQGRSMTPVQALEQAYLASVADKVDDRAKQLLEQGGKKRKQSFTLPPTDNKAPAVKEDERSDEAAMDHLRQLLNA